MRIGITGGPAEGKSTVVGYLRDAGYATVSADDLAREAFGRADVQAELARLLGVAVPVPRETVRDAVFSDVSKRRAVNRVLHPRVVEAMDASAAQIVEVPLLFETCLQARFDCIWVVACGPEEQLRRLTERLGDEAEARRMVQAQLPTKVKSIFADRIIRTNSPVDTVRAYVIEAIAYDLVNHLA